MVSDSMANGGDELRAARDLLAFIDASPSPYHAVAEARRRLGAAGFAELDERQSWRIAAGGRYFVVRGGGTLLAFVAGTEPPAEAGFLVIGAHTDSPNLRVKPLADLASAGLRQISTEIYGGVLLHTWLDRDLSIAGRVVLRGGSVHLVRFSGPVARVPNLAIHLNREITTTGLLLNAQTHLLPVIALDRAAATENFAALVAHELERSGVRAAADDVLGFDLCLFDTQPSTLGGMDDDFLYAPRLDNLASCHAAVEALIAVGGASRASRVVVLYDHEEVGSQSAVGARSLFVHGVLERVSTCYASQDGEGHMARALARSLIVSADMAHAVHPNYADKHDKQHQPKLGSGPVIKTNASQAYATDAVGAAVFEEACREAGVTPQRFVSRNDLVCGSTIGPISAARLGVRTVDVGNPMLSMHSCREMSGSRDVAPMIFALTAVLRSDPKLSPAV
jgi:aspartyl aminopeptidase